MSRPHIEFIHAQDLPWQRDALPGPFAALEAKVLSRDGESGACSAIVRFPVRWSGPRTLRLAPAHELYVLDGRLDRDGRHYGMDCYSYQPAGAETRDWASDIGAVALMFFDSSPVEASTPVQGSADAVPFLDLHEMPWTGKDIDPAVQFLRIVHKVLRHDPATGEKTLVLQCGAHTHPRDWRERALAHPCVEEMFLLSGDIVGDRGIMTPGAYFWRPPHVWHGPFGSRNGNVCLIRFVGGHHVNIWGEQELPFRFDPPHAPALPPDLEPYRGTPRTLSDCY